MQSKSYPRTAHDLLSEMMDNANRKKFLSQDFSCTRFYSFRQWSATGIECCSFAIGYQTPRRESLLTNKSLKLCERKSESRPHQRNSFVPICVFPLCSTESPTVSRFCVRSSSSRSLNGNDESRLTCFSDECFRKKKWVTITFVPV